MVLRETVHYQQRPGGNARAHWTETPGTIEYSVEAPKRVRAGFIGCGGHSYRNVYPTFHYAPVELVAVCDVLEDRAETYRKEMGAERAYTDYREMLDKEDLDCVFVVTNYDERGHPRFARIAIDAMNAGCHAWIEKPPAANIGEVEAMMEAERATGKFVQVGYKKMFVPSYVKAQEIINREEFGGVNQIYIRYPQNFPPLETRFDLANDPHAISMLDHICHPLAILQLLGGDAESLMYTWEPRAGGVMALFNMKNGAIATWHSAGGQQGNAPCERVEVIGKGAHVVVDNTLDVQYYRPAPRHYYGRVMDYFSEDEHAPIRWVPECSRGVLFNDKLFFLGYAPEVRAFAQSVLNGTKPDKAGLRDTWLQVHIYEAFANPPGKLIELQQPPADYA